MNLRSRLTGIATGDQLIFCRRDVYLKQATDGMKVHPLMEDIYLSRCLRAVLNQFALR